MRGWQSSSEKLFLVEERARNRVGLKPAHETGGSTAWIEYLPERIAYAGVRIESACNEGLLHSLGSKIPRPSDAGAHEPGAESAGLALQE